MFGPVLPFFLSCFREGPPFKVNQPKNNKKKETPDADRPLFFLFLFWEGPPASASDGLPSRCSPFRCRGKFVGFNPTVKRTVVYCEHAEKGRFARGEFFFPRFDRF